MDPTGAIPSYTAPQGNQMDIQSGDNYVGTVTFQQMGLKNDLLVDINKCAFEHPSEVQSQVIPKALNKTDILCQAKSGMGKTAVYVISILNQLL